MRSTALISIVGTTATGKTAVALEFARQVLHQGGYQGVDIISADSRQVYADLPLLSGADIPASWYSIPNTQLPNLFFSNTEGTIALHGVTHLSGDARWSVGQFRDLALSVLAWSKQNSRLPLVVGGTGLYHMHLLSLDPELRILPNADWRLQAKNLTLAELQQKLLDSAPERYARLTDSDRANPRRLQRHIEIISAPLPTIDPQERDLIKQYSQKYVGLTMPVAGLETQIEARIEQRIKAGVVAEVMEYVRRFGMAAPAASSLGLAEIVDYSRGIIDIASLKQRWLRAEVQYAKRQITWWKKQSAVTWFAANKIQRKKLISWLLNEIKKK